MKKKEYEQLPIRSIRSALSSPSPSFDINRLQPENIAETLIVEPHRHDFYHIMLVKNGFGTHNIDFKTYEIVPHSIFFVSPGQVHSLTIDSDADGYVISFNPDFYLLNDHVQKLMDFPFFHSICNHPVVRLGGGKERMFATWEEIYEEHQSTRKDKDGIIRSLLELILKRAARMYEQPLEDDTPSYLTFQLRKLESLIDLYFRDLRKLDDYAELMHLSPKHLNNLCKKGINKTVTNLIHERTLIEAKRLLLFTNISISEIAFDLGFSDKSYFMRFFKKNTGQTAEVYRNGKKTI